MDVVNRSQFRLLDYLTYSNVYCEVKDSINQSYYTKTFYESDFTVLPNGSIVWHIDIDSLTIKDNEIIFTYYGSDYKNLITDTQKNAYFRKKKEKFGI